MTRSLISAAAGVLFAAGLAAAPGARRGLSERRGNRRRRGTLSWPSRAARRRRRVPDRPSRGGQARPRKKPRRAGAAQLFRLRLQPLRLRQFRLRPLAGPGRPVNGNVHRRAGNKRIDLRGRWQAVKACRHGAAQVSRPVCYRRRRTARAGRAVGAAYAVVQHRHPVQPDLRPLLYRVLAQERPAGLSDRSRGSRLSRRDRRARPADDNSRVYRRRAVYEPRTDGDA